MTGTLVQLVSVLLGTWIVWKALRFFLTSGPFDNIDGPPSHSFLTGSILEVFDKGAQKLQLALGQKYGRLFAIQNFMGSRSLFVFDPKALYHIFVKDNNVWDEPENIFISNSLIFGPGITATKGERHRHQRKILNPVFSTAHMREMTPVFYSVVHKLRNTLIQKVGKQEQEVEMLEWMVRTALELIGQSAL